MKFFLTIYICSVVAQQCGEVDQNKHAYTQVHDTHVSCVKDGLGESFEILFNGELFKEDEIDKFRFYPKYTCAPFQPEDIQEPGLES